MAKIYGLNGTLRGRQGNNVFAVQNGTQIVRAYQPVVANPRTSSQQLVRARFALAGKISGFTPSLAISGMAGSSQRSRRANFVSGLARAATAAPTGDGYTASLLFANFMFSRGMIARWSAAITPTAVVATGGQVTVTVPGLTALPVSPAGYRELCIVGLFDVSGSPLDRILVQEHSRSGNNVFYFHQNLPVNAVAVVWLSPYIPHTSVAGARAGNVGVSDDNAAATLSSVATTRVADSDWGDSILVSTIALISSRDGGAVPVSEEVTEETK